VFWLLVATAGAVRQGRLFFGAPLFQVTAIHDAVIVNDLDVDFALLRNRPEREVRERRNRVMLSFSGPNNSLSRSPWRWPHSLT
jgi:hypothetical protein